MDKPRPDHGQDQFDFGFAVDWMRKDLGLVLDGPAATAPACLTALVDQFYADVRRWAAAARTPPASSAVCAEELLEHQAWQRVKRLAPQKACQSSQCAPDPSRRRPWPMAIVATRAASMRAPADALCVGRPRPPGQHFPRSHRCPCGERPEM